MTESANDREWRRFIKDYKVVEDIKSLGFKDVYSKDLNEYRESRLMCKIDYRELVPKPLSENRLSVLAIKNGVYRIAETDPFLDLPEENWKLTEAEKTFSIPSHLETLSALNIKSESQALDAAQISGMLEYLCGEKSYLTIRGRAFSSDFNFNLTSSQGLINYEVSGVQIEIDGGYEGEKTLSLFEAKMGASKNMNIRQLLYPYINYKQRTNKKIRSYFFFYENGGLFHFIPFEYKDGLSVFNFESYRLFKLKQELVIQPKDILNIKIDISLTGHGAPFPQADSFPRILELLMIINNAIYITKQDLFFSYDLTPRQYDYYLNALKWLGLVNNGEKNKHISLTERGVYLAESSEQKRILEIARIAFSNDIFNAYLKEDNPNIKDRIKKRNEISSDSTFNRRITTLKSWKKYIFDYLKLLDPDLFK